MARISSVIIGILLSSLFVVAFGTLLINFSDEYDVDFDNTTFSGYDQLAEINELSNTTATELDQLNNPTGVLDVIGGFFSAGYTALKTVFGSFTILTSLISTAVFHLQLGYVFQSTFTTIALIIIFIAVGLSAVLKWRI